MNTQDKDSKLVEVTELLSHLYLGLTRYLDWIHESSEKSQETETEIKSLIQIARGGLEVNLAKNPVVQRSVQDECNLIYAIVEEATKEGITPKLMERMTTERAKLQTKIVTLTDLVALVKAL